MPELTEERLQEAEAWASEIKRRDTIATLTGSLATTVLTLIAALREARETARDYRWEWIEADDDPEEWLRWAYRSGEPEWLEPPQWFIDKHPWMAKPEEGA